MDGQLFLDYVDLLLKQEKAQMGAVSSDATIKNDYQAYELGDIGACEFARQTLLLRNEAGITSVDGQRDYECPPDFIRIARKARDGRTDVLLYTQSGETQGEKIYREPYDGFWDYDTAEEEEIPSGFDVVENPISPLEITGSADANGTLSSGESNLTDLSATFTDGSDLVYPRYRVRNTTNGKDHRGIVLDRTSDTILKTAMFQDTVAQAWTNGDTFAIQSSAKFKLRFKYATSTSGDTIKLDYFCFPPPVFSPIGMWGFPDPSHVMAVAIYAVWWMKVRNVQAQQGDVNTAALTSDRLYLIFDDFVNKAIAGKRSRMDAPIPSPLMEVL
ncbi:MAG: hypothetical protein PHC68_00365 [Syntrophorhabdaceae bacterium]|nr:hypothetical protein [Syntrophorhabdaceae bacterium]